jgi:proline iminopeptidase
LRFFYQVDGGASHIFPEAFDEYISVIPEEERKDVVLAYHAQLNSVDDETRLKAAKAWSKWEYVWAYVK